MPHGDILCHQAITWTSVDLLSNVFGGINLAAILQEGFNTYSCVQDYAFTIISSYPRAKELK